MRVLLVHGMGRTPASMAGLARHLRRDGHACELFGYVAALQHFRAITDRLAHRLAPFAGEGPYAVVAHSLGGLLLRDALARTAAPPVQMVMLGTPNRSPRMARRFRRFWPYRFGTGDPGQLLCEPGFYADLAPPPQPYTIIAGTAGPTGRWSPFGDEPNDWLVAVNETPFADDDRPIELPVDHTFMMLRAAVRAAVRDALSPRARPHGHRR